MGTNTNKLIDIGVILGLPVLYSLAGDKHYAEALGFSIGGGLLGMLFYAVIKKLPAIKRYEVDQTELRKYAIGCVLFSVIGIPSFAMKANEDRQNKETKGAIYEEIGKVGAICVAANHTKKQYCPDIVIEKEMEIDCSTNFSKHIPASIKTEVDQILNSDKFKAQFGMTTRITDEAFSIGKSNAIPLPELCQKYQALFIDTYKSSLKNIESNIENLKK